MPLVIQKNCSLVKFPYGSITVVQDIQYQGSFEFFRELKSISFKLLHFRCIQISHRSHFFQNLQGNFIVIV